ncbi:MAG: GIY-YIG nuclease family protein [Desulfitobacteriaceae bacterium]
MSCTTDRKKVLRDEYKERKTTGGVYKITNMTNDRYVLQGEINVQRFRSRFEFAQKTGSCVLFKLQNEWSKYGAEAFTFEILEEIEQKDTQTTKEFKEDLKVLEQMWAEKFNSEKTY